VCRYLLVQDSHFFLKTGFHWHIQASSQQSSLLLHPTKSHPRQITQRYPRHLFKNPRPLSNLSQEYCPGPHPPSRQDPRPHLLTKGYLRHLLMDPRTLSHLRKAYHPHLDCEDLRSLHIMKGRLLHLLQVEDLFSIL
jgi:hypothetical protein